MDASKIKSITATYIEPSQGHMFYGLYIYKDGDEWTEKLNFKSEIDRLFSAFNINVELPRIFSEDKLKQIAEQFKTSNIKFEFDDCMDVS